MKILRILAIGALLTTMSSSCQPMNNNNNENEKEIVFPMPPSGLNFDENIFNQDYEAGSEFGDNEEKSKEFIKNVYKNINACELFYQTMLRYALNTYKAVRDNPKKALVGAIGGIGAAAYYLGLNRLIPSLSQSSVEVGLPTVSATVPTVANNSALGAWWADKWSAYSKLVTRIPEQLDPAYWVVKTVEAFSQPVATASIELASSVPEVESLAGAALVSSEGRNWKPWLIGGGIAAASVMLTVYWIRKKMLATPAGQLAVEAKKLRRFMDLYSYMRSLGTLNNIGEMYKQPGITKPKKHFKKFYYDLGAYKLILKEILDTIKGIEFPLLEGNRKTPQESHRDTMIGNVESLLTFIGSKEEKLKSGLGFNNDKAEDLKNHVSNLKSYVVGSYKLKVHRLKSLDDYLFDLWNQPPHEVVVKVKKK